MARDESPSEMEVAPGLWVSDLLCAWLPGERTCVVADLHLGFEAVAASDGAHYPVRQAPLLVRRLGEILDRFRPETVVVAGDLKHSFGPDRRRELEEAASVLRYLELHAEVVLLRGNHDNYLQRLLPAGTSLPLMTRVGRFRIAHGHRELPSADRETTGTLIAHEHPSLRMRDGVGGRASAPAFVQDAASGTLVLPAQSPLAPGSDILRGRLLSPVLRGLDRDRFRVIAATGKGLLDFGEAGPLRDWDG